MPPSNSGMFSPVNRLLPYTLLCTVGPSVTAATALFIVVGLILHRHDMDDELTTCPTSAPLCVDTRASEIIIRSRKLGMRPAIDPMWAP